LGLVESGKRLIPIMGGVYLDWRVLSPRLLTKPNFGELRKALFGGYWILGLIN